MFSTKINLSLLHKLFELYIDAHIFPTQNRHTYLETRNLEPNSEPSAPSTTPETKHISQ